MGLEKRTRLKTHNTASGKILERVPVARLPWSWLPHWAWVELTSFTQSCLPCNKWLIELMELPGRGFRRDWMVETRKGMRTRWKSDYRGNMFWWWRIEIGRNMVCKSYLGARWEKKLYCRMEDDSWEESLTAAGLRTNRCSGRSVTAVMYVTLPTVCALIGDRVCVLLEGALTQNTRTFWNKAT